MPLAAPPRFSDYLLKAGVTPVQIPDLSLPKKKPPVDQAAAAMLAQLAASPGIGGAPILPTPAGPSAQQMQIAARQGGILGTQGTQNTPVGRFEAQAEQLRAGTHDPNKGFPEQVGASIATGLELPLMLADLPRQIVTASGGEGFVTALAQNGDWGGVYLIMSNLGAANKSNPLAQRTAEEQAILPEQFGSDVIDTRPIEQRQAEYAAYMSSLPPEQQAAVMQTFVRWMDAKRDQYYTPGRADLKKGITFEEWQALNYDKALAAYVNGWQKPATPVLGPDGRPVPVQPPNENPVFTGGQAVWEAYINELDPAQRAVLDLTHDPFVAVSALAGGAKVGAQAVTKTAPELAAAAKALQGIGTVGDVLGEAGNANIMGLGLGVLAGGAPAAARLAGRKLAPTAIGRGAAAVAERAAQSGLGRFTARAVKAGTYPIQEPEAMRQKFRPFWEGVMERHTITEERNRLANAPPQTSPPGTTPPPGVVDRVGALAAQEDAQTTSFDMAPILAQRESIRRSVPPTTTVPLRKWGKAPDEPGARAFYLNDHTMRAVDRPVLGADGITRQTFTVEEWNKNTGGWDTISEPIPVGGTMTAERAQRGVVGELTRLDDERSSAQFTELGVPLQPGEVYVDWTGPEIKRFFEDHADAEDRGLYEDNPAAEESLRELSAEIMAQVPDDVLPPNADPNFNNLALLEDEGVKVPLVLRGEDFDTITKLHNDLGTERPRPLTTLPTQDLPSPAQNVPPVLPRLGEPAIPLGPIRELGQPAEAAAAPVGTAPAASPAYTQQRTIDVSNLPSPPAAQTIRDLGVPERDTSFGMQPPPETTPVMLDLGIERGTGINGTARNILMEQGDDDLKAAVSRLQSIGKGGNKATYRGQLTVDQAQQARDILQAHHNANMGRANDSLRTSLRESISRLDKALQPGTEEAISPPSLPPTTAALPDTPETYRRGEPLIPERRAPLEVPTPIQRHVRLQKQVRDYLVRVGDAHPELLTDDFRERLRTAPETAPGRGAGSGVEIILSEADADAIRGVRAALDAKEIKIEGATHTNVKRGLRDFDKVWDRSPAAGPGTPLTDRDLPQAPPQTAPEPLEFNRQAPDLAAEQARVLAARSARPGEARMRPPTFTEGAPTTAMGVPREDAIPPQGAPDQSVPFTEAASIRADLPAQRESLAPAPGDVSMQNYLRPFNSSLQQAVKTSVVEDKSGLRQQIGQRLTQAAKDYSNSYNRAGGVQHEVESALQMADGILDALHMLDEADPTGDWKTQFPEFAFGGAFGQNRSVFNREYPGGAVEGDIHGDFDAVMRGVFGSSRDSKVTSTGKQSFKESSAGVVVKSLQNNPDPAAQRLLAEIDQRRREYLDLINRSQSGMYYAGVPAPAAHAVAGGLRDAVAGVRDYVLNTPKGPEVVPRFLPTDKTTFELMSDKGQAALAEEWTNHPTYKGFSGEQVFQDVHNKAVAEIGEYQRLLAANGPVPPGRQVCRP